MTFEFIITILFMTAIAMVPGALTLWAFGVRGSWSIVLSPAIGFGIESIIGQAYAIVGVASTPVNILAPIVAIPAVAALLLRKRVRQISLPDIPVLAIVLSLLLGIALGHTLFVSRLGGADAVFQAYDVTQHLNVIQSMRESGRFSSFGVNPYMSAADAAIAPVDYSGFYPAAWHAFCTLVGMLTSASTPVLINASMYFFCFLVYPMAIVAFLSTAFPSQKNVIIAGSLTSLAFVAFPWELLTFGPVYPNIAGFALMPALLALFVHFLADGESVSGRVRTAVPLALGVIGAVLCHPNIFFTCIVLMVPYCISRILAACKGQSHELVKKISFSAAFIAFCIVFWLFCYHLPMLKDIVSHWWQPYAWLFQELVNIVTVSYHNGFNSEVAAQIPLGILIVLGVVKALRTPGERWTVASYALACYILLIGASHEDEYRNIVAGFWYSDPMRLSAVAALAAVPLATLGLEWTFRFARRVVASYFRKPEAKVRADIVFPVVAAAFLVINFMPEFNLAGVHHELTQSELNEIQTQKLNYRNWPKSVHTTFGDYRRKASETHSYNEPLDHTEEVFLTKAKQIVPDGSLILNDPMDGSFLAYSIYGMRMYYRNFVGFGDVNESAESKLIRLHLNELSINPDVQEAVDKVDAKYVVVLRGKEDEASFINLRGDYDPALFTGITSIAEGTPGFKLLLKTGPMALYEIER